MDEVLAGHAGDVSAPRARSRTSDSKKPRNPRAEMERNRRQMREQMMKEREKRWAEYLSALAVKGLSRS